MKVVFEKVSTTAKPIEAESQGIKLVGQLKKCGYHEVLLEGNLSGSLTLDCDRCGVTYQHEMDTVLKLRLTNVVSEDKDDLDIIEFLDGEIDILYVLESEISSIESSYHYCKKCENNDDFEREY